MALPDSTKQFIEKRLDRYCDERIPEHVKDSWIFCFNAMTQDMISAQMRMRRNKVGVSALEKGYAKSARALAYHVDDPTESMTEDPSERY